MVQYITAVIKSIGHPNGERTVLNEGGVLVIKVETPDDSFDLTAAAKAAALEYCKTEVGKSHFCMDFDRFNWASFAYDLPTEFCEKHGFKILEVQRFSGHVVDWRESLASPEDVYGLNEE